jgi:hypothetical protein
MQAQAQVTTRTRPSMSRHQAVAIILAMHVVVHAMWLAGPWIAPDHDFPLFTRFVTGGSFLIGAAALAGLWNGKRWGWVLMLILTIVNAFLTIPEVFTLPGVLRVLSIAALITIVATLILLFRPGVRPRKA